MLSLRQRFWVSLIITGGCNLVYIVRFSPGMAIIQHKGCQPKIDFPFSLIIVSAFPFYDHFFAPWYTVGIQRLYDRYFKIVALGISRGQFGIVVKSIRHNP